MTENPVSPPSEPSKGALWTSRVLALLVVVVFGGSGAAKLSGNAELARKFTEELGFKDGAITGIGVLELLCVVAFALPKSRFLGAVLLTGYLGGAICTHLRVGQGVVPLLVLGTLVWGALFAVDDRVRRLFIGRQ